MRRVTADEFVTIVVERIKAGEDYHTATWNLLIDDELSLDQLRPGGRRREILESDLVVPGSEYDDDGEAMGSSGSAMEVADELATASGAHMPLDWERPSGDPLSEMCDDVDWMITRLRTQLVNEAVAECLTKHEQAVVHGIFWGGQSQKDIARGLRCSQQAVSASLKRAIHKLREWYGLPGELPVARRRPTWDEARAATFARQRARGRAVEIRLARYAYG